MATGYSRSPRLLKGALVELSSRFIGPVPNIIVFQYNPETLSRTLEPFTPRAPESEAGTEGEAREPTPPPGCGPSMAQPGNPNESFSLSLELDAADALESPGHHPVAAISGVADRIAAMEMLLYPDSEDEGLGGLVGDIVDALGGGGGDEQEPRFSVPIVLFVWGAGRILPVRLTSFSVDEEAFSTLLYPIRAKVSIGLKVVCLQELENHPNRFARDLAIFCWKYTHRQSQTLAMANTANNVESILGILPF